MRREIPRRYSLFVQQVEPSKHKHALRKNDKTEKDNHALVDGPPSGLGNEEVRPDRPRKRETPEDEADVASEIRFVGVDATSSGRAGVKANACVYGRGHGGVNVPQIVDERATHR